MKKIITIAIAIVCCAVSVVSLAEPYEPADDSAAADTIAMLEAQYSTLEGQIVWADEEEFAVYEVFKKEAGTYTTSIGKIKPIVIGIATVVRSKEDSSFVRVEALPYIEIVAPDADWDGGDFSINNDESGIVRISSVGSFIKRPALSNKTVRSENVTVAVNVSFKKSYDWWYDFPQYPVEGQESITYEIEVDGNPVPKDGIVYVNSQTPEILILERMNVREPRDEDWLSGRGFIQDHILEITGEYEETSTDGTTVSAAIYYLKNMVPYVPVKVMLTEELAGRLGLETAELTIIKTFSEKGIS